MHYNHYFHLLPRVTAHQISNESHCSCFYFSEVAAMEIREPITSDTGQEDPPLLLGSPGVVVLIVGQQQNCCTIKFAVHVAQLPLRSSELLGLGLMVGDLLAECPSHFVDRSILS